MNKLTDTELNEIIDVASEANNNKMEELKNTVKVDTEADLEVASANVNNETNEIDVIAKKVDMDLDVDIFDVDTSVKGLFLCSDGLTNMLTEEQIEKILNSDLSIEDTIVKLIRKANSRGGTDNITIAYLKKESGDL